MRVAVYSTHKFEREYLGCFPQETHREKILREFAEEYCERTEKYDRTVCTGPIKNGSILPMTSQEYNLAHTNAVKVRQELLIKMKELGFTNNEFWDAFHLERINHKYGY